MSVDIYAVPDFSKKVRYNRKVQQDAAEREDREVDIYQSAGDIGDDGTDFPPQEGGTKTQKQPGVLKRPLRGAALWLRLLSLLTLAGIVILLILLTLKINCLQTKLEAELRDMRVNSSQLESSYEILSKNNSQLQEEVKKLKDTIEGKSCPKGWTRFGSSCYFKSTEWKTWDESRKECRERRADLVIINNKEEQEFVRGLNWKGASWIGLQRTEQTGWTWTWVDGSPLTEMFWAAGSKADSYWYYAACCNNQGEWTTEYYSGSANWICEK
ncbi:CD209 antigen-like protein E isoform X1 [Brachyistius frenatus]|uniref:CD209 antigen-like protein E isoform X1 n=1 Tax=Brachyistius frenatus TaxID=100188 RepID=UPI0037E96DCF